MKELRNICREVSTISMRFAGVLSAFAQKANNIIICCSRDECLLDFLKVIITAIIYLAPFIDTWPMTQYWQSFRVAPIGQTVNAQPFMKLRK